MAAGVATGASAGPAAAGFSLPVGPNALPSSLLGEAFAVALAFTLPALVAGAVLLAKTAARRLGLKGAMTLGTLGIAAAFGLVVLQQRPDLLTRLAGL